MNFKEIQVTMREAIRLLMLLYQDFSNRAEPFAVVHSELKKMT